MMRPFIIAPAEVHPQPVGGNVCQRAVQCFHMFRGALAKLAEFKVGVLDMTAHPQVGAIDLEIETRGDDRLVFGLHRRGDRSEIGALARIIVVVKEEGYDARRRGRHERPLRGLVADSCRQIIDVAAHAVRVGDGDRAVARRSLPARASGIAEDALRHIGEADQVLIDERVSEPAESGQAILDVGRVARLRHFAVVDDVETRPSLFVDDFLHRGSRALMQGRDIDFFALFLAVHHLNEVVRARQTSGMRGQKAIDAERHLGSPLVHLSDCGGDAGLTRATSGRQVPGGPRPVRFGFGRSRLNWRA